MSNAALKRSVSLPLLTFYGLGTILGAGIYVLTGAVAAAAGQYLPLSFLVAAIIAAFTACTYAELSARLPRSAGEAVYVDVAFGVETATRLIGFSVALIGIVSAATMARGFAGYFALLVDLPEALVIGALVLSLAAVAVVGIQASVWMAAVITLVEIAGLLFVLVVAGEGLLDLRTLRAHVLPPADLDTWRGIGAGAFLAFYAFIGFEDMVNVAEEVRAPEQAMPRAILYALLVSTLLYGLVALAAITSTPLEKLAGNPAPLAAVVEAHGMSPTLIAGVSVLAITNGALVQIVMASRVLYGMARQGSAPAWLGRVSARTQTPVAATLLITGGVLGFAWLLPLTRLAGLTSLVTLLVFATVNAALWRLKATRPHPVGVVRYPMFVPIIGCVLCLLLAMGELLATP